MSSPPAGHPFLRPAISPIGSGGGGTSYYRPMTAPGSDTGHAAAADTTTGSMRSAVSGSRPESRASAGGGGGTGAGARSSSSHAPPTQSNRTSANQSGASGATQRGSDAEPPRKLSRWEEKVQGDLAGWRGGEGKPYSSVPQAGVPSETYFGQPTTGVIGQDLPKEIVRIERDWSLGDICQFSTTFPLELESRLNPETFSTFVESINEPLREAYSVSGAIVDNLIAVATWWTSLFWRTSHFEKELRKTEEIIKRANEETFNPVGLNVLSPRFAALQYLEIEYY